ncbi:unnamed protein product [Colias eurytheme]|nr:unnamed protein product [Colias eurytheme]
MILWRMITSLVMEIISVGTVEIENKQPHLCEDDMAIMLRLLNTERERIYLQAVTEVSHFVQAEWKTQRAPTPDRKSDNSSGDELE